MFGELLAAIQEHLKSPHSVLFAEGEREHFVPEQHSHAFPEIMLQIAGSFTLRSGSVGFLLKPGTLCVIPPGVYHRGSVGGGDKRAFQQIVLGFRESYIIAHKAMVAEEPAPYGAEKFFLIPAEQPLIRSTLDHLIRHFDERGNPKRVEIGMAFFLSLLESAIKKLSPLSAKDKIEIALAIVDQYCLSPDFNLAALAGMLEMNADYLSHAFKKRTGTGFTDYLNERRCRHAAGILKKSDFRICEVAWNSGFGSGNYFNRVFKKRYGISPSLYREIIGISKKLRP